MITKFQLSKEHDKKNYTQKTGKKKACWTDFDSSNRSNEYTWGRIVTCWLLKGQDPRVFEKIEE